MDYRFVLNKINFEADLQKSEKNLKKHDGISFEKAAEAFFDPFFKYVDATRNEENRDAIIGYDKLSRLLFVVFIEKQEDIIRIISARLASKKERKYYEND